MSVFGLSSNETGGSSSYAFDYPCPDSRDMALDVLIPMSANNKDAPGVDWGKKGIAVFESAFEVLESLM